jgi:hypothetical protein
MMTFLYRWTDNLTGMMYVGVHKGNENDGYVCSSKIMMPVYKERPETFVREILEVFDSFEAGRKAEIIFLTEVNAAANALYYNQHNGGNEWFLGAITEETKEKIRKKAIGRLHTTEARQKMSAARKGKPLSEKHKESLKQVKTGTFLTEETKKKISEANKGKGRPSYIMPEAQKEYLRQIHLGHKHSLETRLKIGLSGLGRKHTPETKMKISIVHKGKPKPKLTIEQKQYLSKISKGKPKSAETKEKMRQAALIREERKRCYQVY